MTAGVVELVDTQALGVCDVSRGGSSPSARTKTKLIMELREFNAGYRNQIRGAYS